MPTLSEGLTIAIKGDLSAWNVALTQVHSKGIGAITSLTRTFQTGFRRIRNAGLVAFGGLSALIGKSVHDVAAFEKSFSEVTTLLDDMPTQGIESLRAGVQDLSKLYGQDVVDQTRALYQTISSGATEASKSIQFLDTANKMSIGGLVDVEGAVDVLTSALSSYNLQAGDVEDVSDVLFQTMKAGKTTISELAGSLGRVMSVAAQMNVPLEEVGAAVATMTRAGLATDEAITALRGTLIQTLKPSREAQEVAESLGITLGEAGLQGRQFNEYLNELYKAVGGNSEAMAQLFPNVRALNGVLAMTGDGAKDFEEILTAMAGRAGSTSEAFAKMSDTMWFKWNQLKATIGALWREIGEAFLPIVEKLVARATPVVQAIGEWISRNQDLVATGAMVVAGLGAVMAAVGSLGLVLTPLITTVMGLFAAFSSIAGIIGVGVAVGGGLALLPLVAALAAGFVDLGGGVDAFVDNPAQALLTAFRKIIEKGKELVAWIKESWNLTIPDILKIALFAITDFGNRVINVFKGIYDVIAWVIDKVSWLIEKVREARDAIPAWMRQGAGYIADAAGVSLPFQTGGHVRGPGGLDMVPARLTAGEFVVNRQAMQIAGPIVEAINNLGRGMSTGGPITVSISTPRIDRNTLRESILPELRTLRRTGWS